MTQVRIQGLDPARFAGLVADAESVEELEPEEIQGERMTGLTATVTAEDVAKARRDPHTTTPVTEPIDAPEPGSLGDLFGDLEYEVEAWMGGDDNVRRLVLTQSTEQLGVAIDDPELESGPSIGIVFTLDLFDYRDESIEVELPDTEDTEDITAAVRRLVES